MGGGSTEVNVGLILQKRITWIGTTLRVTPAGTARPGLSQRFIDEMLPLFDLGVLRPIVDSAFRSTRSRPAMHGWSRTRTWARS